MRILWASLILAVGVIVSLVLALNVWTTMTRVNEDLGREAFPAGLIALGIGATGIISIAVFAVVMRKRFAARQSSTDSN
jgi:hypothetical protein